MDYDEEQFRENVGSIQDFLESISRSHGQSKATVVRAVNELHYASNKGFVRDLDLEKSDWDALFRLLQSVWKVPLRMYQQDIHLFHKILDAIVHTVSTVEAMDYFSMAFANENALEYRILFQKLITLAFRQLSVESIAMYDNTKEAGFMGLVTMATGSRGNNQPSTGTLGSNTANSHASSVGSLHKDDRSLSFFRSSSSQSPLEPQSASMNTLASGNASALSAAAVTDVSTPAPSTGESAYSTPLSADYSAIATLRSFLWWCGATFEELQTDVVKHALANIRSFAHSPTEQEAKAVAACLDILLSFVAGGLITLSETAISSGNEDSTTKRRDVTSGRISLLSISEDSKDLSKPASIPPPQTSSTSRAVFVPPPHPLNIQRSNQASAKGFPTDEEVLQHILVLYKCNVTGENNVSVLNEWIFPMVHIQTRLLALNFDHLFRRWLTALTSSIQAENKDIPSNKIVIVLHAVFNILKELSGIVAKEQLTQRVSPARSSQSSNYSFDLATQGKFIRQLLTPLLCVHIKSENNRIADSALLFFKQKYICQLLLGIDYTQLPNPMPSPIQEVINKPASIVQSSLILTNSAFAEIKQCLQSVLLALYREGQGHWNPTVNKWTFYSLRNIAAAVGLLELVARVHLLNRTEKGPLLSRVWHRTQDSPHPQSVNVTSDSEKLDLWASQLLLFLNRSTQKTGGSAASRASAFVASPETESISDQASNVTISMQGNIPMDAPIAVFESLPADALQKVWHLARKPGFLILDAILNSIIAPAHASSHTAGSTLSAGAHHGSPVTSAGLSRPSDVSGGAPLSHASAQRYAKYPTHVRPAIPALGGAPYLSSNTPHALPLPSASSAQAPFSLHSGFPKPGANGLISLGVAPWANKPAATPMPLPRITNSDRLSAQRLDNTPASAFLQYLLNIRPTDYSDTESDDATMDLKTYADTKEEKLGSISFQKTSLDGQEEQEGLTAAPLSSILSQTFEKKESIMFTDLIFGSELGGGAFSMVKRCKVVPRPPRQRNPITGELFVPLPPPYAEWPEYAVKIINRSLLRQAAETPTTENAAKGESVNATDAQNTSKSASNAPADKKSQYERSVEREIAVLNQLTHPGVTRLVSAFYWSGSAFLLLEYANGGDLQQYIAKNGPLPVDAARFLFAEAAVALQYIHSLGFVFGDIKPENLVLISQPYDKKQATRAARRRQRSKNAALQCGGMDATTDFSGTESAFPSVQDEAVAFSNDKTLSIDPKTGASLVENLGNLVTHAVQREKEDLSGESLYSVHVKLTDFGACRPITKAAREYLRSCGTFWSKLRRGEVWDLEQSSATSLPVHQLAGTSNDETTTFDSTSVIGSYPSTFANDGGCENMLVDPDASGNATSSDGEGSDLMDDEEGLLEGTREYMAPELFDYQDPTDAHTVKVPTIASDAYAFGITLYRCLTGDLPDSESLAAYYSHASQDSAFQPSHSSSASIKHSVHFDIAQSLFPAEFPEAAKELIVALLHPLPEKRLGSGPGGMLEVLAHPFFSSLGPVDAILKLHLRRGTLMRFEEESSSTVRDKKWGRRHNSTLFTPMPKHLAVFESSSGASPAPMSLSRSGVTGTSGRMQGAQLSNLESGRGVRKDLDEMGVSEENEDVPRKKTKELVFSWQDITRLDSLPPMKASGV